jgi:putative hydrolase of HD superfamily
MSMLYPKEGTAASTESPGELAPRQRPGYTLAMRVKGPIPLEVLPVEGDPTLVSYLQTAQLKRLFRQGWLKRGVSEADCESVADHSFGVALLALLAPEPEGVRLDRSKAALLALVHELGEVYAGDITPVDGVSKEEKARLERASLERLLDGHPEAAAIRSLWEEFEEGTSAEAAFVRQLDRLEMGIQAATYRAEGRPGMEEFLQSADRSVRGEELRALLRIASEASAVAK